MDKLKKVVSLMLIIATTLCILPITQKSDVMASETGKYYAVKIGDTCNSASVAASIAKGYYQYNPNNSYSKDGLKVDRSVVNILFVANCWSDGSYKWLNDSHTRIQVCFNGKTFIFSDGSYYYTSNGKKKPLTVAFGTKTKPKANDPRDLGGYGITDSRYLNIMNATDHVFDQRSFIDSGLHDMAIEIKDRIFSCQYLNVPISMLLNEGFIAAGAITGLDEGEVVMYIPRDKYRKASLSFNDSNKIAEGSTLTVNYRDQFNSLPADIRKIAARNYNAAALQKKPFQTKFSKKSYTTAAKAKEAEKNRVAFRYYGNKTTSHGVDISFIMDAGQREGLYSLFSTLGLPEDFAKHLYTDGINGDWQYEYTQKMVRSYKAESGETYKYVLGRLEGISNIQEYYTINILVPGHPAMPGEYFEGAFYKYSHAGNLTANPPAKDLGTREDFFLNYELPNNVRVKFGLPKIKGNVNTWAQWRKAYSGNKQGLIKSAYPVQ